MKKIVALLSIAAIAITLTASPAFAKNHGNHEGDQSDHSEKNFKSFINLSAKLDKHDDGEDNDDSATDQFTLTGTVGSTTTGSIIVNVTSSHNLPALTNNLATVNVNANTKYIAGKQPTVSLADVKAGQQVIIEGTVNGTTLTAQEVEIRLPKGKVYGAVTAKTGNSITVKNGVTGAMQTLTTDADTKVKINGETKTVADIQVGDRGFVKFKTTLAGFLAKIINLFR
ncbi:MAG TPA: hypothetical protein VF974_00120 [Patescibacteria group bacterium]